MATYQRIKAIDILTGDEVQALMDIAQSDHTKATATGMRNRAFIALLYKSGLRLFEALSLTPADVTTRGAQTTLNVRCGKGGKQRTSVLFNGAALELNRWLETRAALGISDDAPIFCAISSTKLGKPLTQPYVSAMLNRLAGHAGITKRVHPHGFRHAHATELWHRDVPVATIQVQLGHGDPLTTVNYLSSIGLSDAHRQLANVVW